VVEPAVHADAEQVDAAVAELVVFRGKGILVDADFADGGFGRELASGKSVDVNLTAVRSGGGAREGLQL